MPLLFLVSVYDSFREQINIDYHSNNVFTAVSATDLEGLLTDIFPRHHPSCLETVNLFNDCPFRSSAQYNHHAPGEKTSRRL
jgi:hypothetical protein